MTERKKNRTASIRQSAAFWPYRSAVSDFKAFVTACAEMGLDGIDLVEPDDWPIVREAGLVATMVPGAGTIEAGLNDRGNHERCMKEVTRNIPAAARAGWPNVITFSGSRAGRSDEEAWDACEEILRRAVPLAEEHGVTICLELLNSKVDHPDYQCDRTSWGVELCRRIGSPRFKLLYDIYHMQIMEGDIIRTLEANIEHIAHLHTGGNPGRSDLDGSQELNYGAISRAIADLADAGRYDGFVAHEFFPRTGIDSLREAVRIVREA